MISLQVIFTIVQLFGLGIFASVSFVWENSEGIEKKFKTQNPNPSPSGSDSEPASPARNQIEAKRLRNKKGRVERNLSFAENDQVWFFLRSGRFREVPGGSGKFLEVPGGPTGSWGVIGRSERWVTYHNAMASIENFCPKCIRDKSPI